MFRLHLTNTILNVVVSGIVPGLSIVLEVVASPAGQAPQISIKIEVEDKRS